MKKYFICFVGTNNGETIEAENMVSAKWIFAKKNNINSIGYLVGRKTK